MNGEHRIASPLRTPTAPSGADRPRIIATLPKQFRISPTLRTLGNGRPVAKGSPRDIRLAGRLNAPAPAVDPEPPIHDSDSRGARSRSPNSFKRSPALARRVTIADVAKICGVTPATVSRVLNGKKKFSASEAVRTKIFDTAQKLGYVPDLAARNLNRQSTHIIGVFASPETHVGEGINESLLEGMAEVLHAGGFEVFFELAAVKGKALPFWRFDGAMLMQSPKPEIISELDKRRVPYVCVNEQAGSPIATVLADDAMGMRRAVEHLASLGHRKIAYANARATYLTHHSVTERYETLLEVSREKGLELARGHDMPLTSAVDFLRNAVLSDGATAVITYDHQIGVMMVGSAYQLGLRIPLDFSLLCFNDVFPVALMGPPLSVVAVSGREMGRVGADLLLNGLLADRPDRIEIRIPEDLILRASTGAPPTTSPRQSRSSRS